MKLEDRINVLAERLAVLESRFHLLERERFRPPGQKQETSKAPREASSHEDNPASRQISLSTHIQPPPSNGNKTENPWHKTFAGWKLRLEVIAIPFAILYAIVTVFQWKDLRHNFEVEQRAWLKTQTLWPESVDVNTDAAIPIKEMNVGKSPALHSTVIATFQVVERSKTPYPPKDYVTYAEGSMLFPNGEFPFRVKAEGPDNMRKFSSKEISALMDGEAYFTVWGTIIYEDQFGKHWTKFCDWRAYGPNAKNKAFNTYPCAINANTVGDGEPPEFIRRELEKASKHYQQQD